MGGTALTLGLIALLTKKGSKSHINSGNIFFWAMLASAILAIIVTMIPQHESPFLLVVGIFSTYLILSGKRAVHYKAENLNLTFDKLLAFIMLGTALCMISVPIILNGKMNIILTVFGAIGLLLAVQDLRGFKNRIKLKDSWLQAHLGKMIGGYISAVTAFLAVGQYFHPLVNWLGPTVIGVPLIIIWTRKVAKK